MIPISDKCAEIMLSNIRPKAIPKIVAKSTDKNGNIKTIEWQPNNIKSLTFKREIDPIGRTLPYIELVWTEVYNERQDFEETKKYLSASKYMAVNLTIEQKLGFYNNWETLFASKKTWKQLFNNQTTWKQLKNEVSSEIITFPTLFLEDKPKVDGLTITWTARDFLFFLDGEIKTTINPPGSLNNPHFFTFIKGVFAKEKERFENYKEIYNKIQDAENTASGLIQTLQYPFNNLTLYKPIYVTENSKNAILHYLNIENIFLEFSLDGTLMFHPWGIYWGIGAPKTAFYKKTMYLLPKKTKNSDISRYEYTYSEFDGNGEWVSYNKNVDFGNFGQEFNERNPLNPYVFSSDQITQRKHFLQKYFNSFVVTLEFECLPNFELMPGDTVGVQSNNNYTNGESIMYQGVLVSQTLTYNGAFKQKTIVHEVNPGVG